MPSAELSPGVANLLDQFNRHLRIERRRSPLTAGSYSRTVETFLLYLSGSPSLLAIELRSITRRQCVDFLQSPSHTIAKDPSASVWNARLYALRAFFRFMIERELAAEDPTCAIESHRVSAKEVVPLSLEEFAKLLKAAERSSPPLRSRNVAILLVFCTTGLRVRELVSLRLEQFDLAGRLLRDIATKGAKWHLSKLPQIAADALAGYLSDRPRVSRADEQAIFVSKDGRRLTVRAVEQLVAKLGRAAGIPRRITPHLFRHTCATELHERGASMRVIQKICNHASIATTEGYVHAPSGADRIAVEALGRALAKALRAHRDRALAA